ncbi:hypothetical protein CXG81DRAFT_18215 [Caulochytrium protostelioides]|uniref:Uncharacterized protein n=1 Tax=Caulochytrium protostelioides TaxID=1555241 RepID=A0A4P9WVV7_9FUNG|nr:hypothetical protein CAUPRSCDRAFT_10882 [Caulochytrium protostelioides]RKP02040.1 hypothetical protein CXG81DRAFT_18215 [Caulochytrium protostelioides]|eukprot:RKP02040.1 hypothetical protein CXG81DRAFT_18215 [Caulochytrium protostelioides]
MEITSRESALLIPVQFWYTLPNGFMLDLSASPSLQRFYNAVGIISVILGVFALVFYTVYRKHPVIKSRVYHFMMMDVFILVMANLVNGSANTGSGWYKWWQDRPAWLQHSTTEAFLCCIVMSTIIRTVTLYRTIQIHTPMTRLPYIDVVIDWVVDFYGYFFAGREYRRLKMQLQLTQKERSSNLPKMLGGSSDDRKEPVTFDTADITWGVGSLPGNMHRITENTADMKSTMKHSTTRDSFPVSSQGSRSFLKSAEFSSIAWCVFRYAVMWCAAFGTCTLNTRRLVGELDQVPVGHLGPMLTAWADVISCFLVSGMMPLVLVILRTALFVRWDSLGMVLELIFVRGALNITEITIAMIFLAADMSFAKGAQTCLGASLFLEILSTSLWPPAVVMWAAFQKRRFRRKAETTQLKSEEAMEEFYNSSIGHEMVRAITAKNYAVENFVFLEVTQKPLTPKQFGNVYRDLIDHHGPWQINITSALYERWGKALKDAQDQAVVIKDTRHAVFSLLIANYRHVLIKQVHDLD